MDANLNASLNDNLAEVNVLKLFDLFHPKTYSVKGQPLAINRKLHVEIKGARPNKHETLDNYNLASFYSLMIQSRISNSPIKFVGSQPEQIQERSVTRLMNSSLYVTPKIDGMRFLMVCNNTSFGFVNRDNKFFVPVKEKFISGVQNTDSTIFDTEVYFDNGILQIFIFDYLFHSKNQFIKNGGKTKEIYKSPYHERMESLEKDFGIFRSRFNSETCKIYIKKNIRYSDVFFDSSSGSIDIYDRIKSLWETEMGFDRTSGEIPNYDGVIFINGWYRYYLEGLAFGQYKWKPSDELTVDLKYNSNSTKKGELVSKNGLAWNPFESQNSQNSQKFDLTLEDGTALEDGSVYEFRIDTSRKKFVGKRQREKGANALQTLISVYDAIKTPVKLENIRRSFVSIIDGIENDDTLQSKSKSKSNITSDMLSWISTNKPKLISMCYLFVSGITFFNEPMIYDKYKDFVSDSGSKIYTDFIGQDQLKIIDIIASTTSEENIGENIGDILESIFIDPDIDINTLHTTLHNELRNVRNVSNEYKIMVEFNKKFDSGFKAETKNPENVALRNKNLSQKIIDVNHLIYKLKFIARTAPKLPDTFPKITKLLEREFISVYGKSKDVSSKQTDIYVYNFDKSKMEYTFKEIRNPPLSDTIQESYEDIFGYDINLNFYKYNRKEFINPENMFYRNPEKHFEGVINRKRFKKIYLLDYPDTPLVTIRLIKMKEFSLRKTRTGKSEWNDAPEKKSFIEIDISKDFKKTYNTVETIKSERNEGKQIRPTMKIMKSREIFVDETILMGQINTAINRILKDLF